MGRAIHFPALANHIHLSRMKSAQLPLVLFQASIKTLHQIAGFRIGNLEQTGQQSPGTSIKKGAAETIDSLVRFDISQAGLAGAEPLIRCRAG